jgi:hypothetical protein
MELTMADKLQVVLAIVFAANTLKLWGLIVILSCIFVWRLPDIISAFG